MTMMVLGGPAKGMLAQIELDEQENFTPKQIEKFKSDPEFYREFVKTMEKDINGAFPLVSAQDSRVVAWNIPTNTWFLCRFLTAVQSRRLLPRR
jgi:hypothetical protein